MVSRLILAGDSKMIFESVLNFLGGERSNRANAKEAGRNRDFQERMSNTKHQRETADLEAAGLNRILSVTQPGASTPQGSTAQHQNTLGPAVSTALQKQKQQAEIDLITKQADKIQSEKTQIDQNIGLKNPASKVLEDAGGLYDAGKGFIQSGEIQNTLGNLFGNSSKAVQDGIDKIKKLKLPDIKLPDIPNPADLTKKMRLQDEIKKLEKIKFTDTTKRYRKLSNGKWYDLKTRKIVDMR